MGSWCRIRWRTYPRRMNHQLPVQHLRISDPNLDFWIDVRLMEHNGRWLAVADLADTPELGVGHDPQSALREALSPFGSTVAERVARWALTEGVGSRTPPDREHGATAA